RKEKRKNKIFIDWLRNGRGATSVAPYSIRARKGAKVSMPILWKELDEVAPDDINMKQAILRTREEDPWKGFFENHQGLN
ncbi:MAG: DNA ligase, partial [Tissierellia bacterium]|nr:DNA ligase [Tissierellia bacterium]